MEFYTYVGRLGNKVIARGHRGGKRYSEYISYRPYIFLPAKKPTQTHTLSSLPVDRMDFASISDAREFIQKYENVPNFEMFGLTSWEYTFIYDNWKGTIAFDPKLIRVVTIDIEVESEQGFASPSDPQECINAITLRKGDVTVSLGLGRFSPPENVTYIFCTSETELLQKFLEVWKTLDPDILTGWYIRFFDVPYLYNRIKRVLGEKAALRLSPFNKIKPRDITIGGQTQTEYELVGIATLDYLEVFKKFDGKSHESYSLNTIAHEVLGERKLDFGEHITLKNLYQSDFQRYMEYNIHDVHLVDCIEKAKGFMEMIISVAYLCKVNYIDVFKQTRMWDALIHNHLRNKNIVVPFRKRAQKASPYRGAFVKDPQVGMHWWLASFDLNSLYPHLIMQYNIGPDTLIENLYRNFTIDDVLAGRVQNTTEHSMAANGYFFRKDEQSFMAELMQKLYDDRVVAKKGMLEAKAKYEATRDQKFSTERERLKNLQNALKITLNSAYGAIGNEHFRFYDVRLAEAVTVSGQLSIMFIAQCLNRYMNAACATENEDYIIAIDTDSVYLKLQPLLEKLNHQANLTFVEKILGTAIEPFIAKSFQKLATQMGAYEQRMVMKCETIADRGIWTAKKRYALNMLVEEGVHFKSPKLKVIGLDCVRSTTPMWVRKRIENTLKIILRREETAVQRYLGLCRGKFNTLKFDQIASPKGVNGLAKYGGNSNVYKLGTPIHVRASLLYNKMVKELNLTTKYPLIREGEKIKYSYLKTPNPIHENVIGAIDFLPPEFELEEYLDHEEQFNKTFRDPIQNVLDTIGWHTEKKANLDEHFTYD